MLLLVLLFLQPADDKKDAEEAADKAAVMDVDGPAAAEEEQVTSRTCCVGTALQNGQFETLMACLEKNTCPPCVRGLLGLAPGER